MPTKAIRNSAPLKKRPKKKPIAERVRFLVDQCPHRITGVVNIPGLQLLAPEHESSHEHHLLLLLALCVDVVAVESQTEKIKFRRLDGTEGNYSLDIKVTKADGEAIRVEVKPVADALCGETLEKLLGVAQHYAAAKSECFDVISDEAVGLQPRLSIAQRLRGFLMHAVDDQARESIEASLADGPKRIGGILAELGSNQHWADILALTAQRHLCIPWDEPYGRDMYVSLPGHPIGHERPVEVAIQSE